MAYPVPMRLSETLAILRELAPEYLAEPWDRVGLQVGDEEDRKPITRALLCIDLTEPVLDEAMACGAQLIVSYHPPIFKPLPALTAADPKQRIILRAARAGIAVYSPHTALDAVPGGVNDFLAVGVGEGAVRPIRPAISAERAAHYKLVTFVPEAHVDRLRSALAKAGAGRIGHYSDCSFSAAGEGTFRGDETTHPAVGQAGQLERVPEVRLEMVVPPDRLAEAVAALRAQHPYEEPAFDLYPLSSEPRRVVADTPIVGQGRIVQLKRPVSLATLITRLKRHLRVKQLEVAPATSGVSGGGASGGRRSSIRKVGLCAGAGGSLLGEAGDIDLFFTGEMRHHDVLAATADGIAVILAGHTETERPYLKRYRQRIIDAGADGIDWLISQKDRPPLRRS